MTNTELLALCDEVDRHDKAATAGPWPEQCTAEGALPDDMFAQLGPFTPSLTQALDDSEFAAFARTALPILAAEVRRLVEELSERDRRIERLTVELKNWYSAFSWRVSTNADGCYSVKSTVIHPLMGRTRAALAEEAKP